MTNQPIKLFDHDVQAGLAFIVADAKSFSLKSASKTDKI